MRQHRLRALSAAALSAGLLWVAAAGAAPASQDVPPVGAPTMGPASAPAPNATRCADGAITWSDTPERVCADRGGIAAREFHPEP